MGRQATTEERAAFMDRTAELYRLFKKGTRTSKDVLAGLQQLIDGAPITKSTAPVSPFQASAIMGNNMFGPEDTAHCFDVIFTPEELDRLEVIPFSIDVLQACADSHVLVACAALSLMDIWNAYPDHFTFTRGKDPWFKREHFARTKAKAGWQLIRKSPLPGSVSSTWNEGGNFLGTDDMVPSTSVIAQAVLIYDALANDIDMFKTYLLRTSDLATNGTRVFINGFQRNALLVGSLRDDEHVSLLGLASCKKPN